MSYLSDVQSLFLGRASRGANDRVQVTALPSRCRLRGVVVTLSGSQGGAPNRIDFLLEDDEGGGAPDDADVLFSAGGSAWVPVQNMFIPDDSYIQLTDKLWFTSVDADILTNTNLTVFYTV